MPANPQAVDSLKNKGNRLAGFSRANSDADAHYNVPAPKQAVVPARSDTPHAAAQPEQTLLTREEIAKNSRIQVPSKPRRQTPGAPALQVSPQKNTKLSPVKPRPEPELQTRPQPEPENFADDEDATNRALFEGSQLGDDFMNSRLTTPRNEPDDVYLYHQERLKSHQQPFQEQERVVSPELGHEIVRHQKAQHRSNAKFQMLDGRVAYNPPRDQLRDRSNVRDGFSNEPLQERAHQRDNRHTPASPAKPTKDLPYRPVKIKPQKKENRHSKHRMQEPSPYDNFSQHPANSRYTSAGEVIDLEDEGQPIDDPGQEATPKQQPRRVQKKPQQTLMESAMPPPSRLFNQHQHIGKRTRASLDYDDKALSQKTFADLLNEPFDLDPAQAGNDQAGDGNPLSNKLDRFAHQSEDDQRTFFASMPMAEWEESGDWLVDRFTDLMQRMKEARREKRKIVADFEGEAAKRDAAVQARSDALDHKMQKMRENGMRMVGERQA